MTAISIKQLLEAGVHFGHQTHRWNPKMQPFIFGERNGIHIIDLQKTLKLFKEAVDFVTGLAAQGKTVLFVGTKNQAQESVEEEAKRCGMFFITNRWLGGLLTNFVTVQNSIRRYRELESMRDNGFYEKLSKKEVARLERERKRFEKNLRGIREMDRCPDVLFVVDSNEESIAVREAARLQIPIVAIVDTNSDPDLIDYVIPGNDDALRAIKLFTETIAEAVLAGRAQYQARVEAEQQEAAERAAREAAQRRAAKEAAEAAKQAARAAETEAKAQEKEAGPSEGETPDAAAAAPATPLKAEAVKSETGEEERAATPAEEAEARQPEAKGAEEAAARKATKETAAKAVKSKAKTAKKKTKKAAAKKKAAARKAQSGKNESKSQEESPAEASADSATSSQSQPAEDKVQVDS